MLGIFHSIGGFCVYVQVQNLKNAVACLLKFRLEVSL